MRTTDVMQIKALEVSPQRHDQCDPEKSAVLVSSSASPARGRGTGISRSEWGRARGGPRTAPRGAAGAWACAGGRI